MPTVVCERCGKSVERYPSQIKRGGRFCSRACQNLRTGELRDCVVCGTSFYVPLCRVRRGDGRFCSCACKGKWQSEFSVGDKNPAWNGGRFLDPASGYIYIRRGCRYIGEHRLVMEQHLGRALASSEHVHHLNGDKVDNRADNLEVVSASEHFRRHWTFRA